MGADMEHLADDDGAVFMHRVGDLAEARNDRVIAGAELPPGQDRRLMDRYRFDHDHPGTPSGAFPVIAEMPFRGQAVDAHIGGMGAKDDAVLQRLVANGQRLEQLAVVST